MNKPHAVHYFPASGFSFRFTGRGNRPIFRFSTSPWRREEINRYEAARLIRAARKLSR